MPERKATDHGHFVWPEATVKDVKAARAFYGPLLGWAFEDSPGGFYTEMKVGGKSVAGLCALNPKQAAAGAAPHWMGYVSVPSADATAAKAASLGGRILAEPFDVPHVGRMCVMLDPTGAQVAVWQPGGHGAAAVVGEPGTMAWNELVTRDPAAAGPFYTGLFGWTSQVMPNGTPSGDYTIFLRGGEMAAGMMRLHGTWWAPDLPSHWMTYLAVADCDGTAAKAPGLGGTLLVPPTDIPNIGRFAVIRAPGGEVFSVIRMGPA
jgi:hypothetical protein